MSKILFSLFEQKPLSAIKSLGIIQLKEIVHSARCRDLLSGPKWNSRTSSVLKIELTFTVFLTPSIARSFDVLNINPILNNNNFFISNYDLFKKIKPVKLTSCVDNLKNRKFLTELSKSYFGIYCISTKVRFNAGKVWSFWLRDLKLKFKLYKFFNEKNSLNLIRDLLFTNAFEND